ncbi:hypothetical protein BGZ65_009065, partial [Modicella reniformis]
MATPAPPALSHSRNNDTATLDEDTPLSPQRHQHQQETSFAQRQIKSSKSTDGLRRVRSHTMDPGARNPRKNFGDAHINPPSLTQTQLDAYESTFKNHDQVVPEHSVSSSHRNGNGSQSRHRHGSGHSSDRSSIEQDQHHPSSPHASQPLPHSPPAISQSPYQNLNVQTTQIASRSTPKLTFIPMQSHYTNESKETRSFNGSPGQMEPKPKSKTSKLKPIVLVENTNEDHVERDQYGFKKESQWLAHHDFVIFETYYIPIMERRRQKWAIFMNDSQGELPPRSAKLKRYIRKGIPPALRGE